MLALGVGVRVIYLAIIVGEGMRHKLHRMIDARGRVHSEVVLSHDWVQDVGVGEGREAHRRQRDNR